MQCNELVSEIDSFLKTLGIGRRPINDPLFENSHNVCKVFERRGVVIEDEEELCHNVMKEFRCQACEATFQNLLEYELHYHSTHHFVCAECKKSMPTSRLLEIHIQETHDNFFKALSEKQPMYQCFVAACNVKLKDPAERREHCREMHAFPKNYRFYEMPSMKENNKNEESMEISESESIKKNDYKVNLGKKSKQKTFSNKFSKSQNHDDNNINYPQNSITTDTNMLPVTMFIPRPVQMQQKSYAKLLTKNQKMETNVLETDSLMELQDSLPNH